MHAFHLRISFNFPDLSIAPGRSTIYHPVILPTSLDAVTRARVAYDNKERWNALVGHAMREDFSWKRSAKLYIGLYKDIH